MKISNSQISSFQRCEKRFFFEHILKLKPNSYPEAVEKGMSGHDMMKAFFRAMLEGCDYEECVAAINPFIEDSLQDMSQTGVLEVYRHVLAFGAYVFAQPWIIVSVEESNLIPVEDNEYAFTADCIFEWNVGPKRGQRFVIDFKFTGQYWNDQEVNMNQQLPKYLIYTNELYSANVRNAAVVMLNTRAAQGATGAKLWQLKWLPITKHKLQRIKYENEILIKRVVFAKENWTENDYMRTNNSKECKMCWFAGDLCPADLEGRPTHRIIERSYEVNTYFDDNYEQEKK